jgi:hypothetical protein
VDVLDGETVDAGLIRFKSCEAQARKSAHKSICHHHVGAHLVSLCSCSNEQQAQLLIVRSPATNQSPDSSSMMEAHLLVDGGNTAQ